MLLIFGDFVFIRRPTLHLLVGPLRLSPMLPNPVFAIRKADYLQYLVGYFLDLLLISQGS